MTPTGSDHFSYKAARMRKTISSAIKNAGIAELAERFSCKAWAVQSSS